MRNEGSDRSQLERGWERLKGAPSFVLPSSSLVIPDLLQHGQERGDTKPVPNGADSSWVRAPLFPHKGEASRLGSWKKPQSSPRDPSSAFPHKFVFSPLESLPEKIPWWTWGFGGGIWDLLGNRELQPGCCREMDFGDHQSKTSAGDPESEETSSVTRGGIGLMMGWMIWGTLGVFWRVWSPELRSSVCCAGRSPRREGRVSPVPPHEATAGKSLTSLVTKPTKRDRGKRGNTTLTPLFGLGGESPCEE